jgi:hypothetical protein
MYTAAMRRRLLCLVVLFPVTLAAQDAIRTADITVRGLKTTDFPRVKKLAGERVLLRADRSDQLEQEQLTCSNELVQ